MNISYTTYLYIATILLGILFALSYTAVFAATKHEVCVTEKTEGGKEERKCYTIEIEDITPTTPGPESAPKAPSVKSPVTNGVVSGTAEPKSKINAFSTTSGLSCTTTTKDDGAYECTLNGTPTSGEFIYVTATNSKGTSPVGRARAAVTEQSRGFLREGIFGCQAGQYGMAVGTLQAIGGVYVPVNDAAVTLNTGYLVYKECVLDGVTSTMVEAAAGAIVKSILNAANRGRGGAPEYPVRISKEVQDRADETLVGVLKEYNLKNICAPFKQQVKVEIAKEYMRQTRDPNDAFRCSLGLPPNELNEFLSGDVSKGGVDGLWELIVNQSNNAWGSYQNSEAIAKQNIGTEVSSLITQWDWGNGLYPREELFESPTETGETRLERRTLTPGFIQSQILGQAVTSGYRKLENADEIDEIINALFSGITNQIMTDIRGLTGLSESKLGRAPYLEQLSAEASGRLRESATNAALSIINASLAVEQEYNSKKREIKSILEQAAAQLRSAEAQCWVRVEGAVRALATAQGVSIRVSTSTSIISGGTVALRLPKDAALQAILFTFQVPPSSLIKSGTFAFTVTGATTSSVEQALGFTIQGPQGAPSAGGTIALLTAPIPSFTAGVLTLILADGQTFPVGDVRFALTAVAPFLQGAVSIVVDIARQFADKVIADQIQPILDQAIIDLETSNNALALLIQIANDLRNTSSLTAQRIALERLDTLIAERAIHTAFDIKSAQKQREEVEIAAKTLIEDTVRSWAENGGWCDVNNPAVVQQWLDKWKI